MNRVTFNQTLTESEVIYVRQIVEIAELFGYESRNRFSIQSQNGREFAYCKEPKLDWQDAFARQIFGHWRNFDLIGTDHLGQKTFRAHHPHRWFMQRLDLYSAGDRYLGSLQQQFQWFNRKFDYLDPQGKVIFTMTGSFWKPWTFPIFRGLAKVAVIEKKWSGAMKEIFTDADNFRIRFVDQKFTNDQKLLLLVSAIFVDLLYFERHAG